MLKRSPQEHLNNIALAFLNIVALTISGFLMEFELAKAHRPDVGWPNTPSGINWAVAGTMILASIMVLAILALIYKKGLYNRPYLWWITGFNILAGVAVLKITSQNIGLGTLINFVLFP